MGRLKFQQNSISDQTNSPNPSQLCRDPMAWDGLLSRTEHVPSTGAEMPAVGVLGFTTPRLSHLNQRFNLVICQPGKTFQHLRRL